MDIIVLLAIINLMISEFGVHVTPMSVHQLSYAYAHSFALNAQMQMPLQ